MKNTRTLGGSFIWPTPKKSEGFRNSKYNMSRGVVSYIEDRVYLTLLEIKHALDGEYHKSQHKDDILYALYIKNTDGIRTWLDHFETFEKFDDYFMFNYFIENGMPINILTGKAICEEEVKKYFKNARVIRMDVDTTRDKNSYERIYNSFKNGEADILIGTQMISKGLDFKNVTLVGILAADMSINIPDYRAAERTFQIITQVAGRAGRGKDAGKVIIQTYNPDSFAIECVKTQNEEMFYNTEMRLRKQ